MLIDISQHVYRTLRQRVTNAVIISYVDFLRNYVDDTTRKISMDTPRFRERSVGIASCTGVY